MKEKLKKPAIFLGLLLMFTFSFMGSEYLLYRLLSARSKLYYPFYIIFIAIVSVTVTLLNKVKLFGKVLNLCLVLGSMLIGLWLLSMLIKSI